MTGQFMYGGIVTSNTVLLRFQHHKVRQRNADKLLKTSQFNQRSQNDLLPRLHKPAYPCNITDRYHIKQSNVVCNINTIIQHCIHVGFNYLVCKKRCLIPDIEASFLVKLEATCAASLHHLLTEVTDLCFKLRELCIQCITENSSPSSSSSSSRHSKFAHDTLTIEELHNQFCL